MLKPQKKMTKKELKEDKFVETAMKTRAYIEDNVKQVSIVTGLVFGTFLLIMVYNYVHSSTVAESATLFGEAQLEYQNMNYTKAATLLSRLEEEYPGTEAGDQGLFLLGNLYFQQNKIDQAAEYFKRFVDSYSGSEILKASGYAGYAACLEAQNKSKEAAEYYIEAQKADPEFVEASNYLYLAALNYIEINDYKSAQALFNQIVDDYPEAQRVPDAQAQLILIAAK